MEELVDLFDFLNSVFSRGSSRVEAPTFNHGDLVVANWTSYIDIIYLASK